MSKKMDTSAAREVISTIPFKLFQKVKTPFGEGRIQYYVLDRGKLKLVVSQTNKDLKGENKIRGLWILRFLDPNEVENVPEKG